MTRASRRTGVSPEFAVGSGAPVLTVVIPTRNEAGNVGPLLDRLEQALAGLDADVLFVDDSDDATPDAVTAAASTSELPIRLIMRPPAERSGGLGGAVLRGLAASSARYVVVMDGDLQHPPELVPRLVAEAERAGQDVVVASRHVPGGSDGGLAGWRRRAASRAATGLARAACPRALRGISDPMSGFFAVRREALALEALKPQGFKILVEILARHPHLRRGEVPFVFAERHAGQSKAGAAEGWRFLRLLMHLRVRGGWHSRMIQFGLVGLAGLAVNTVALWLFATPMWGGLPYLVAAVLATQVSSAWNFFGYETWVYPGAKRSRWWSRLLRTTAVNDAALIFRLPLMALLVEIVGIGYLVANALTLFLLFVSRFLVSDRLIYNQG